MLSFSSYTLGLIIEERLREARAHIALARHIQRCIEGERKAGKKAKKEGMVVKIRKQPFPEESA